MGRMFRSLGSVKAHNLAASRIEWDLRDYFRDYKATGLLIIPTLVFDTNACNLFPIGGVCLNTSYVKRS